MIFLLKLLVFLSLTVIMRLAIIYLEPAAAIAEIQSNVATIRGKPADDKLALYAKYFVAELVGRWLDDMENGGRNALKSIKQDDTEYQFAVSDASQAGSTLESDLAALRPRLNLYRKLRWTI